MKEKNCPLVFIYKKFFCKIIIIMKQSKFTKNIELVENYEPAKADGFTNWHIHHRLETHTSDGKRRSVNITKEELIALDMYYNRPSEELIFLTNSEHAKLHQSEQNNSRAKRIICIETGKIYLCAKDLCKIYNKSKDAVYKAIKRNSKTLGGLHYKFID